MEYLAYLQWWHWVVFGALLLGIDIALINIYFLFFFGAGAMLTGFVLLGWPSASPEIQFIFWAASSLAFILAWLFVWRPITLAHAVQRDIAEAGKMVGASGTVVRSAPGGGTMRFQRPVGGRDIWPFVSRHAFAPGQRVIVSSVNEDGQLLIEPRSKES